MNFSKNLNVLLIGALSGVFFSSWLGQKVIAWWIKPPVDYGVNCDSSVTYSMERLIIVQAVAAIIFALLFFIIKLLIFSSKKAKIDDVTTTTNTNN